ncbi:trigger factor [Roseiarcus fermentans]|uniref:Trigger factor n=1 Tax=Roseiarcus fermentans TaxID=1473586 RepID=A0A366F5N2_9HYPH|nr:trigger factor [Roseiarcus fermentans]RBP09079.1 trigger factor [Roseiarcus fermentans]
MQVTETLSQGLKREYDIFLPASDLAAKLNSQLAEMRSKAQIKGFRPGKVPLEHLRRIYGKSVMADVVQTAINTANKQIVDDNKLRLAREPRVNLPEDQSTIEAALEARGDLSFKIALEVLPTFEIGDFSELELERLTADVEDSEIATAIDRLADGRRTFADRGEGAKAENGDRVTIDFDGKIDGVAFEGGDGRDIPVLIGSNTFIPGFEEQLVGAAAGERRVITATFPEAYAAPALAGKTAEFDVTVKTVEAPEALEIDDAFAAGLGMESLDKLKEFVRDRMAADYAKFSRDKIKRQLLDKLDTLYTFELPEGLVNQEFDGIWAQVTQEQQSSGKSFADENTTEEAARADYRRIAERRVRLGLLLAEVGARAAVRIEDDEISQAVIARARQFPGQEKQVWDFYRNNQQALAELRAPIYEEKVVDHILGLAKVTERKVPREELIKPLEDELPAAKAAEPVTAAAADQPAETADQPAETVAAAPAGQPAD